MAEVKWIKITTNMFEDEKIDFIESLPECDAILIMWIKLLTLAGKTNSNGYIYLTENIPYTDEMLSHKFRRPLNTVKLALQTLKQLEMIDYNEEGFLKISNWEKHQNVAGLDKIREDTRLRVAKHREKQKALNSNVTCNVTVTEGNATEEEENRIEEDTTRLMKLDKDLIIKTWNDLNMQQLRNINSNTKRCDSLKARIKEYSLDEVIQVIKSVKESNFLQGKNNRGWQATFDWVLLPNNFVKVLEGNYTDKKTTSTRGNIPTAANTLGEREEDILCKMLKNSS